jgi:hypothetical protein
VRKDNSPTSIKKKSLVVMSYLLHPDTQFWLRTRHRESSISFMGSDFLVSVVVLHSLSGALCGRGPHCLLLWDHSYTFQWSQGIILRQSSSKCRTELTPLCSGALVHGLNCGTSLSSGELSRTQMCRTHPFGSVSIDLTGMWASVCLKNLPQVILLSVQWSLTITGLETRDSVSRESLLF